MEKCCRNRCVQLTILTARWIPVLFLTSIMAWAYYAYAYQLCFNIITNHLQRLVYLMIFHIMLLLFMWSYFQTVFSTIGTPPRLFALPQEVKDELYLANNESSYRSILDRFVRQTTVPIVNQAFDGGPRLCMKCSIIKPDRAHHCSVCGNCILKFDHHCPWVNTCINFRNYKFFVLFLGYGFYLCIFGFFSILPYFIRFWRDSDFSRKNFGPFHVLFLFFVSGMFGISLGCLFIYHIYLTTKNRTTIESFRPPVFRHGVDKNAYNMGLKRNFREIFGSNKLFWFIPIFTSLGDGIDYPLKSSPAHTCGLSPSDAIEYNNYSSEIVMLKMEI